MGVNLFAPHFEIVMNLVHVCDLLLFEEISLQEHWEHV